MPRPKNKDRCLTCRIRKIKCDEAKPVCHQCAQSGRQCERGPPSPITTHSRPESQRSLASSRQSSVLDLNEFPLVPSLLPSANEPMTALSDPRVFHIFRHYIDKLAVWYDLNEKKRPFEDVVPTLALTNPILLSAILAFSAIHLCHTTYQPQMREVAEFYHLECIGQLIPLIRHNEQPTDGSFLASTCLLRSYEILAQNVSSEHHLSGSYGFISQGLRLIGRDLFSAGFWNYLREDITVALMKKRPLKIDLSTIQAPTELIEDDDWANHITYLLGNIINQCLGSDMMATNSEQWAALMAEVQAWHGSLPPSYTALSPSNPQSSFPTLWLLNGWHIGGWTYYYVSMVILLLSEPMSPEANAWERIQRKHEVNRDIEVFTGKLCGIAISNVNDSARINALGPISFCGTWIRDQYQRSEILMELRKWQPMTGWPIGEVVDILQASWSSTSASTLSPTMVSPISTPAMT